MKEYSAFKDFIMPLIKHIRLVLFRVKWRKNNKHNYTIPNNIYPIDRVSVGNYTYGNLNIKYYGNKNGHVSIGSYCSIAEEVIFIMDGEHDYTSFSTYPFSSVILRDGKDSISKGPIIVEDDVWIGYRSMILSGVTLGKGCVIAAGSVVSRNVPSYSIYIHGHTVKYRFNKDIVDIVKTIDFNKLDSDRITKLKHIFKNSCNSYNKDYMIKLINNILYNNKL